MIKDRDKVRLTYWRLKRGVVIRAGLEVSEVKFDNGHTGFYMNEHLEKIDNGLHPEPNSASPTTRQKRKARGEVLPERKGAVQRAAKGRQAHDNPKARESRLQR